MAIKSVELQKGDTTKRVQIGSKAYDRYTSQGYSLVSGSGRNLSRSETKSIFQGISEPSPQLKALSIALATGQPIPEGVTDNEGKSAAGRVYSSDGTYRMIQDLQAERDAAAASAAEAEQLATDTRAKGAVTETLIGGGNAQPFASATAFTKPTFDTQRYGQNQDFFNQMFDPGATANTTPMFGGGGYQGFNQGAVGGGAGGGGGGSWGGGGGGGFTWGDGSGQYTPGITGDGQALTATRNLGVPSPTNKEQANQAGVPDTGGQTAANSTTASPNDSLLRKTMMQLITALTAQRDLLQQQLTGTAEPVDNAVANMDNALTTAYEAALADLPDYEKMKQDAKDLYELKADLIEDRRDTLEDRYKEDKAAIEADFATQKDELKESQKGQTGRMAGGLASAGAYLGFDNVNHSAMLSLQVTHDREMTVLGQAKIAALSEARRAFEDGDFALLTEHINAIEAYDKKITDLANTHFTQTLQLTQEARANVKFMQDTEAFNRTKGFDNLDVIIEGGTMPTEADINNYARTFGLSPEDVRGYITAKQATIQLDKDRQKTADDIALANLLLDVPMGSTVTINGKTYAGKKPAAAKTGSADAGTDIVSSKDWYDKYGANPLAQGFVGGTTNELYNFFGQEVVPPEAYEYYKAEGEAEGTLDADPDMANAQIQLAWETDRRSILGQPQRVDIGAMDADTITAAVNEINQTLIDNEGPDIDRTLLITEQDIYENPYEYPKSFIELQAANNEIRRLREETAAKSGGGGFFGFGGREEE